MLGEPMIESNEVSAWSFEFVKLSHSEVSSFEAELAVSKFFVSNLIYKQDYLHGKIGHRLLGQGCQTRCLKPINHLCHCF